MTASGTWRTEAGLFARHDRGQALLVYSPFTGLLFAVPEIDRKKTVSWLEQRSQAAPSPQYLRSLGAGWCIAPEDERYPTPHELGGPDAFPASPLPTRPLVINWLLTARCPLACRYCDAGDMLGCEEPSISTIERTARAILKLNPLAVVLTGGEPLASPHLERALALLRGRAGMIVDTSGFVAKSEHLRLFRSLGVALRISLDSERPKVNDGYRKVHSVGLKGDVESQSSLRSALSVLCEAIDLGLCVTVQSVASSHNLAGLEPLGDKLYRLGVRSWRILKVQRSLGKEEYYEELVGAQKRYKYYFGQLEKARRTRWGEKMALQITYNSVLNAVVLVAPDGSFLTESDRGHGKIVLDQDRPRSPRIRAIFPRVNSQAHAARYLNATLQQGM